MSDKNIDKDIEILKEVQGIFEHLKIHGWINDIKREADINKVILTISRAIEYIKNAELTKIACCTAQNCEALNNSIRFGKELETYKNMADLMAEEMIMTRPMTTEEYKTHKYREYSNGQIVMSKKEKLEYFRKRVEEDDKSKKIDI